MFVTSSVSQRSLGVRQNVKEEGKKIHFHYSLKMEHPGERIISTTFPRDAHTDHMGLRVITVSSINVDPGDSSITETNIPPT